MEETQYIDIHTHTPRPGVLALLSYAIGIDRPPGESSFFSAGIHPWSVENIDVDLTLSCLNLIKAAAIGETGLDYSTTIDRDRQRKVFIEQLRIASARDLPVVIHCVKAYNEVLKILSEFRLKAVIFHGYTGSTQQTQTILDRGYYISLGEKSLRSSRTLVALEELKPDRIFAETDNSGADIKDIYDRLAIAVGINTEELKIRIEKNLKNIFG